MEHKPNGKLGIIYYDDSEYEQHNFYKILDSDKRWIGNYYSNNLYALSQMSLITDLQALGVCDNLIFGRSKDEVLEEYRKWSIEDDLIADSDAETIYQHLFLGEDQKELESYICRIGDIYFIPNFTEL